MNKLFLAQAFVLTFGIIQSPSLANDAEQHPLSDSSSTDQLEKDIKRGLNRAISSMQMADNGS